MPKLVPGMTNDQVALAVEVADRSVYLRSLYERYDRDLRWVRRDQGVLYHGALSGSYPQFDDIECDIRDERIGRLWKQ